MHVRVPDAAWGRHCIRLQRREFGMSGFEWEFCRFSVSNSWTMFEETCDFMLYCVFMVDLGLEFGVLSSEEEAIGADCDRLA